VSVKVAGLVWDYYPEGGGELLTMLRLADHAEHDGTRIWPSIAYTAALTRQSPRTVQRQIQAAIDNGWLVVLQEGGKGPGSTTRYRIPVERIPNGPGVRVTKCHPSRDLVDLRTTPDAEKGDTEREKGDTAMSPESSLKPTVLNRQAETPKTENKGQGQNRPAGPACAHCDGPITNGYTSLRIGNVCNPCYAGYLNGEWRPERAA